MSRSEERTREKILLFAGTTEGRVIAREASKCGRDCTVSTATEYGELVLSDISGIRCIHGRMDEDKIVSYIVENNMTTVIDATHPFAKEATKQIRAAAAHTGVRYIRCLRGQTEESMDAAVVVESVQEAVAWLSGTKGTVLISTGSKELHLYTELPDYTKRCYARVLSTPEAVSDAAKTGLSGRRLIAMQGPFSKEMNVETLRYAGADYFVTKDSGSAGGFSEKLSAAKEVGATLVVVRRPSEVGESLEDVLRWIRE